MCYVTTNPPWLNTTVTQPSSSFFPPYTGTVEVQAHLTEECKEEIRAIVREALEQERASSPLETPGKKKEGEEREEEETHG